MTSIAHFSPRRAVRLVASTALGLLVVATLCAGAEPRIPRDQSKAGDGVLRAFRPVVADAVKSTVRILAPSSDAADKEPRELALGVVVSADGMILTKGSQLRKDLLCRLPNGKTIKAEPVAESADLDLTLLHVDATGLTPIAWSETVVSVGQWLATASMDSIPAAVGVVSVKPRSIPRDRAVLGVSVADVEKGAKVMDILPESGAIRAGIREGDVIVEVAGTAIKTGADLADRVSVFRTGQTIEVKLLRDDKPMSLDVVLGRRNSESSSRGLVQNQLGGELSTRRDGFPEAIQHDTVLRPEDCGGPVVGLDGKAIGLNIARAGRTESFALPASVLLPAIEAMKKAAAARTPISVAPAK